MFEILSNVKGFVWRHKKKFLATGITIGGTVWAIRYAQKKLIEYQQEQTQKFIDLAKRTQHFESTERTCNQAIMGFAAPTYQEILNKINCEQVVEQLKTNPAANKVELWNELKILAFTRLTTLIYTCSMLVVSMRIQMNLLGGYMYKDTVSTTEDTIKTDIQQSYLSLTEHFLKHGIAELSQLIECKVRQILSGYDLKQQLSLAETEQIFWSIQMAINSDTNDPNSSLARYVFPKQIDTTSTTLTMLHSETLDLFESDETSTLCTNNISQGFSLMMDNIAEFFHTQTKAISKVDHNSNGKSFVAGTTKKELNVENNAWNINNVRLPLAKLIPIINGLVSKPYNAEFQSTSLSTALINLYVTSDKLRLFGANIYEIFSQ